MVRTHWATTRRVKSGITCLECTVWDTCFWVKACNHASTYKVTCLWVNKWCFPIGLCCCKDRSPAITHQVTLIFFCLFVSVTWCMKSSRFEFSHQIMGTIIIDCRGSISHKTRHVTQGKLLLWPVPIVSTIKTKACKLRVCVTQPKSLCKSIPGWLSSCSKFLLFKCVVSYQDNPKQFHPWTKCFQPKRMAYISSWCWRLEWINLIPGSCEHQVNNKRSWKQSLNYKSIHSDESIDRWKTNQSID